MMGKLPALLGHLGGFRRLGFLAWTADQRSLKATAAISTETQLSVELSREAAIWASTTFNAEPILGLTILPMPIRLHPKFLFLFNNGCTKQRDKEALSDKNGEFVCLMFYTFGTSLTLLFWKVEGKEKSVARAFAWIPSAERKKCLAALLVETTSTWFQVPSLLPIVLCRPIVISLLFFFLQIERKWMDAQRTMKLIFLLASPEEKKGCSVQLCYTGCAMWCGIFEVA